MITVIVVNVEWYGFTLPNCIQRGGDGIADCSLLIRLLHKEQSVLGLQFGQTYQSQENLEHLR